MLHQHEFRIRVRKHYHLRQAGLLELVLQRRMKYIWQVSMLCLNQYSDQSIQEINAKIEIIQAEDKNLELRLKQLDTEQDAISTEMDAVQKVIEKNTESTFKTFG